MGKIIIEFFHDVICSFCFPMSYRMRQIEKIMPDIEIVHRSFALVKDESDFDKMFTSRVAAKEEIMSHWAHANDNDDLHRFNIDGMRQTDFLFPASMKGLVACKAAFFVGGNAEYWDVFDALQNAFFVESRNIGDEEVIAEIIREVNIDFDQWKHHYSDLKTKEAVENDLLLAKQYRINSVPSLIINGKYHVSGAQPMPQIINAIYTSTEEVNQSKNSGGSCRFDGEKMECD